MLEQGAAPVRDPERTAATWLETPLDRWTLWHVGELVPTQEVSRGPGPVRSLPTAAEEHDVAEVAVNRVEGSTATVGEVLRDSFTDAFAVAYRGEVVVEEYAPGGGPDQLHSVLSVTKSVVGCVAGILVDRGLLDVTREVASYVPELAGSGYDGATVRDLLDMRSGVRFVEDYTDPGSHLRQMDDWIADGGLYAFLRTLDAERPHGEQFLYRSAETDALGWVCERAAGQPMAELVSELVWQPMGAEHDAEILCDATGTAVHDGGLLATTRDLLRFGQLLLDGGTVPDGAGGTRTVVPASWLRQAWAVDSDIRGAFLASPSEHSFPAGWYRNQFWLRPGEHGDVLVCLGIHGQLVHVSRRTQTVCVKLSGWPTAQEPTLMQDTLRACDAIGGALDHRAARGDGRGLPGVVSGLSRAGSDGRRSRSSIV